jgi:hypothetical protein
MTGSDLLNLAQGMPANDMNVEARRVVPTGT